MVRAVVVGVVLVAATVPVRAEVPQIAAPTALVATPIHAGQWTLYREHVGAQDTGMVLFAAGGDATCGRWFQVVLQSADSSTTRFWELCIGGDQQIDVARLDGKEVSIAEHARELEPLRTRVLPPRFAGSFVREDLTVAAGRFEGTLRVDASSTTWLHPEVPLGAVVKVRSGDRVDELVRYGRTEPASFTHPVTVERSTPLVYLEGALGTGWLSGMPGAMSNQLAVRHLALGLSISAATDIVIVFDSGDSSSHAMSPDEVNRTYTGSFGLRIAPFRHSFRPHGIFDLASLFIQATSGYARVETGPLTVGNGLVLAPAAGWEFVRAHEWALSAQVTDELAIYDGTVGAHQTLSGILAIQLRTP